MIEYFFFFQLISINAEEINNKSMLIKCIHIKMNNNEMLDVVLNGISEEDVNNKEQIINMLIKSFNKAKIPGSKRAQHFKEMIKLIQSKESNEELSFYNVRFKTVNSFIDKIFLTEQEINKYKKHSNKDINDTIIELLTISWLNILRIYYK